MTVLMVEALLTTIQAILGVIPLVAADLRVEAVVVAGATDRSKKGNSSARHWLKGFPFLLAQIWYPTLFHQSLLANGKYPYKPRPIHPNCTLLQRPSV